VSLEIITTADGSNSLRNLTLNETYHSVHGAIQESLHVFIENGLESRLAKLEREIFIFEVGFGTGLNALLTWKRAQTHRRKISYTTIEPFPLPEDIWTALNYPIDLHSRWEYDLLHRSPWQVGITLDPYFELLKLQTTLQDARPQGEGFDIIYYDAFAPSKQPELWELPMLEKVIMTLRPGGVFVTYCAKGQVKRYLRSLQLNVETLSGPPGKKEMVRAIRQ
jgi:tRNA U34 5-methylaminomethyl-2-thiouridine-forming methyltransferase MnmC